MPKSHRKTKVVKITSYQAVKRGNWLLRFSVTDMASILLIAMNSLNQENVFLKFFNNEEEVVSFVDFLVTQDYYHIDN